MTEMPHEPPLDLDQIGAALAAFQAEMPTVPKAHTANVRSEKGSYSYTYAGLADVTEAAMPLLAKHGLSFVTLPGPNVLTGMLLHKSGQSLTATLPIHGSNPQQIGSSLTYMRRYLMGCMTGVVTDDDDDGAAASRPKSSGSGQSRKADQSLTQGGSPTKAVSEAQVGKMGALMRELGMTDRDYALAYVRDVVRRDVGSRKDLTSAEASQVIKALERDAAGDAS